MRKIKHWNSSYSNLYRFGKRECFKIERIRCNDVSAIWENVSRAIDDKFNPRIRLRRSPEIQNFLR